MTKKKKNKIIVACVCTVLVIALLLMAIIPLAIGDVQTISLKPNYGSCTQIDLSKKPKGLPQDLEYLYEFTEIDKIDGYMAHPDAVVLDDGRILQMYPKGHGKGAVLNKISADGGISYTQQIENSPESWVNSLETPTVYKLNLTDGSTKLVMTSANPDWHHDGSTPGGFNCSVSNDDGKNWSEFELFYPKDEEDGVIPIVAMASLTQLKEDGNFVDKWMAFFHDADFYNYKTILTFDENGNPKWSKPVKYFSEYREIEKDVNMCEVEVIRNDMGKGNELCLMARSNNKYRSAIISFSQDEGETWSEPQYLPDALNGERYKAEYTPDGRLAITFRSINHDTLGLYKSLYTHARNRFYSEGPIMWVGTYDDLKNGNDGQYRIKLQHTYYDNQKRPTKIANPDTGYCGNVILDDGTIVISNYGKFSPNEKCKDENGKTTLKTYISSKRIKLDDIDKLNNFLIN